MDTDLPNRLNERLSVERSLHGINTGVQNQMLVAYPVMIYRWVRLARQGGLHFYECRLLCFDTNLFENKNIAA